MTTFKELAEAIDTLSDLEDMGDETVIPIWPSGGPMDAGFAKYPQLTVGMVRKVSDALNQLSRCVDAEKARDIATRALAAE